LIFTVDAPNISPMGAPDPDSLGHPKGTLAIVLVYALLFVLGWLFFYFGEFLPRG